MAEDEGVMSGGDEDNGMECGLFPWSVKSVSTEERGNAKKEPSPCVVFVGKNLRGRTQRK